jgi:hypothetical protein
MVLAVGASIINIALKQVILSGAGRESQFAFYAANTGLECALYWDLTGAGTVEGSTDFEYVFPPAGQAGSRTNSVGALDCSGTNIATGISSHAQEYTTRIGTEGAGGWIFSNNGDTTVFRIAISSNGLDTPEVLYCAEVTVEKTIRGDGDHYTRITSQGLNTCDPDNDNRAVQRGIVLEYRS